MIVALFVVTILSVIAGTALESTLPAELQDYIKTPENVEMNFVTAITILVISGALFIVLPVSAIGLWLFLPWGRTLFIIVSIVLYAVYFFVGPMIMTAWEALFSDIASLLEGIIIAMMFCGSTGEEFKKRIKEA